MLEDFFGLVSLFNIIYYTFSELLVIFNLHIISKDVKILCLNSS